MWIDLYLPKTVMPIETVPKIKQQLDTVFVGFVSVRVRLRKHITIWRKG